MNGWLFWILPTASVLVLCFAWYLRKQLMKTSEAASQMIKIAQAFRKGLCPATIVDTVVNPFNGISGSSLNILIKLIVYGGYCDGRPHHNIEFTLINSK